MSHHEAGSPARLTQKKKARARNTAAGPNIPEPYTGSVVHKAFTLRDLPTSEILAEVLKTNGIDTSMWGEGNTKDVSKFWKEIQLDEAGFEIWKRPDGQLDPVRVTHVLRAKVSSPECYDRDVFLFNTWQQYGDGRKRTRNGLLSEKLTVSEMPLEKNLHEVCQRAVTEEEMQRVVSADVHIGKGMPAPEYDGSIPCPLKVVDEVFVDHTVEIEASKSYPGLVTVYHLYTVDIICEGLPTVNFNTLEFEHPKDGKRKLKYIHAWVWLRWDTIQRYLLEGSVMKERISRGSMKSLKQFQDWLSQFDVEHHEWGQAKLRDLYNEVEREETQLEHWGRQDGAPLLLRVVHVLQVKVTTEAQVSGKFLFQESKQRVDGTFQPINRLLAKKLNTSKLPFDGAFFKKVTQEALEEQLAFIADEHFQLNPEKLPVVQDLEKSMIKAMSVEFDNHRYHLENSPTYKGVQTMYHLYTVEAHCEGLPSQAFSSIRFNDKESAKVEACVWRWVSWQNTLDILHARAQDLLDRDKSRSGALRATTSEGAAAVTELRAILSRMQSDHPQDEQVKQLKNVLLNLESKVISPLRQLTAEPDADAMLAADRLPPSLISNLADRKLVSDDFLIEVNMNRKSVQRIPASKVAPEPKEGGSSTVSSGADESWLSQLLCSCKVTK